jgi:hypothetical protein
MCVNRHKSCRYTRSLENRPFSARILRLEKLAGGEIMVKLASSKGFNEKYAALSHCWGPQQTCITTKANLDSRKRGIPWAELPPTFQDSITFCLALGISYIWIDALCILQDDQVDWQIESSRMADIYQKSHITLAATSSDSGSSGCFPKTALISEHRLKAQMGSGECHAVLIREKLVHWSLRLSEPLKQSFPLLTRGWAFQERLLAPRVLHLCNKELVWECTEETSCQCGSMPVTEGIKARFPLVTHQTKAAHFKETRVCYEDLRTGESEELERNSSSASLGVSVQGPLGENLSESDLEEIYRQRMENDALDKRNSLGKSEHQSVYGFNFPPGALNYRLRRHTVGSAIHKLGNTSLQVVGEWHKIVEQYSALRLTRETDRLPALSGLSSRTSPFLGSYFAGLWKDSFRLNLTWRVDQLSVDSMRQLVYRGPSWSWVSVKDRVSYWNEAEITGSLPPRENRWYETISQPEIECVVKSAGRNPFGEIASAAIVVRARLLKARLKNRTSAASSLATGKAFQQIYELQIEILHPGDKRSGGVRDTVDLPFFADYILSDDKSNPHIIPLESEILLLALFPDICLVLAFAKQLKGIDVYHRIGIVKRPSAFRDVYKIDWMTDASLFTVAIV